MICDGSYTGVSSELKKKKKDEANEITCFPLPPNNKSENIKLCQTEI